MLSVYVDVGYTERRATPAAILNIWCLKWFLLLQKAFSEFPFIEFFSALFHLFQTWEVFIIL